MLLFAAAALAASPPLPPPVTPAVQATATIRIISAVKIKLNAPANPGAPPPRASLVRVGDGIMLPAKLIEFQ